MSPVSLPRKVSCVAPASTSTAGLQALTSTVNKCAEQWRNAFNFNFNHASDSDKCAKNLDSSTSLAERPAEGAGSPRQMLGTKWKEYAGCNDWEGLLDPLDANLRREIIKYGEFVQATYTAMDFDPTSKTYGRCKYSKHSLLAEVGLPSCGYRVTRHIHATSGVHVPQWLTSHSDGDATWMSRRTSWVGFVAVCEDPKEIERLGRRDIVVTYRGTVTPLEWVENLRDILTPVGTPAGGDATGRVDCEAKVQSGFWRLYTCEDRSGRSASSEVMDEIRRLLKLYEGEEVSITVTGHSLGAALSLLTAYQLGADSAFRSCKSRRPVPITVFSFGGPRVGNRAFGRRMEEMGSKVLRVVNAQDVITRVPGVPMLNETSEKELGWAYSHVGRELRVNSKESPYLKPDADMACCHDLEAYLHLIDGFFSSSTPFRSSAKRDILRLLVNQKSNVLLKAAKGNCHSGTNNKFRYDADNYARS
ncbi:hypothetical protein KI387_043843 [Taxus chinensis]|uniref:Fungal lipase-type domain-containing protein n=1 Tax=Taxus chinensis TaxID=29808 RepID=A0AA38CPF0_TAXCH|nr:hypothetical protein KI387_043843 [Taxus chinensis]